jgi:glycosyltransferase involved in cell wall biosynthesis
MGKHGTVAVIIPTLNRRELVVQAVTSVMEQRYADLCCIVVDNGSTDGTAEAVTALGDPRVSLLAFEAPVGAARRTMVALIVNEFSGNRSRPGERTISGTPLTAP